MMRKGIFALGIMVIIFQLCFVPVVSAKLYTWVDKNGVTRRTYYPPPADQVKKKNTGQKHSVSRKKTSNQVELFITSWCPYCKKATDYFRSRGIKIKVYDIEKDRKAAMRKKSLDKGGGVPFAIVNGKTISGYSPEQYARALK